MLTNVRQIKKLQRMYPKKIILKINLYFTPNYKNKWVKKKKVNKVMNFMFVSNLFNFF